MKRKHFLMRANVLLFSLMACFSVTAQDWNEFRGLNGVGHAEFKNVPTEWSDDSSNIVWKTSLPGLGWSSPVISKTDIWLTTAEEDSGKLSVLKLDLKTGKLVDSIVVFEKKLGKIHKKNSHASPSAIIDGDLLFVHFGEHGTACLKSSGEIVWKKNFKYGHFHGPGGSPIIHKDKVIISCDGGDAQFLVALNKMTGDEIWRTKKKHIHPARFSGGKMKAISFSTPSLRTVNGKTEVICPGADHIAGFDPDTGVEKWWAAYDGYSVVPRPVFFEDMVFYASSYNSPVLYGLKLGGTGEITDKVAWETKKGAPHNPTPIVVGEEIYVVSDRGVAQCMDAKSGKVHWQKRLGKAYSASPIYVDGHIFFQDEFGETIVIKPGKTFEQVAKNRVTGRTLATPVPIDSGLLIRTDKYLVRFGGK